MSDVYGVANDLWCAIDGSLNLLNDPGHAHREIADHEQIARAKDNSDFEIGDPGANVDRFRRALGAQRPAKHPKRRAKNWLTANESMILHSENHIAMQPSILIAMLTAPCDPDDHDAGNRGAEAQNSSEAA